MLIHLFVPCLANDLYPAAAEATRALLERAGCAVRYDPRQTCCGQAGWNGGDPEAARRAARHTATLFPPPHPVVGPSGSCIAFIRHHYAALTGDADLPGRVFELTEFLHRRLGWRPTTPVRGTVAYHPSCHQARALPDRESPLALLAAVPGLTVFPLEEECCGFGGYFHAKMAPVSEALALEKLRRIRATGATRLVSTDPGCLMNIETASRKAGFPLEVSHIAELLLEAAGGAGDAPRGGEARR